MSLPALQGPAYQPVPPSKALVPVSAAKVLGRPVSQGSNASLPGLGVLQKLLRTREKQRQDIKRWMAPSSEDLRTESSARNWAERSFSILKGETSPSSVQPVLALPAPKQIPVLTDQRAVRPAIEAPVQQQSLKRLIGPVEQQTLPAPQARITGPAEQAALPPPGDETPEKVSPEQAARYLSEDFLGNRRVRGVLRAGDLTTLPADADIPRIILQIARQFGMTREAVADMGDRYRIKDRVQWLGVYDLLQKANRAERDHLDQKRYESGWLSEALSRLLVRAGLRGKVHDASFRRLSGRDYAEGWEGLRQRALEFHKHAFGALIRFPYHLFDTFMFGYFRRAVSFELLHSTEDFFAVRDALDAERAAKDGGRVEPRPSAERWLENAMQRHAHAAAGLYTRVRANNTVRALAHYLWRPVLDPLFQFLWRRTTMAAGNAVAMGLVAGLLPLPVFALPLASIPVMGQVLASVQTGLPVAAAGLPFIGDSAAAGTHKIMQALFGDLTAGSFLNTFILSASMTFPTVARERFMDGRHGTLQPPPMLSRDWWRGIASSAVSGTFWSKQGKSMLGMLTVGAEIEAVMGGAGGMDLVLDPLWKSVFGAELHLFHNAAAAIEKPQGESPIPFGGAMSWGNVLLYRLQNVLGFNLTDATYRLVRGASDGLHGDVLARAIALKQDPGQSAVSSALAALAEKPGPAGDMARELSAVRGRIQELENRIAAQEGRKGTLAAESRPVTEAERARYRELLDALSAGKDEAAILSKLSEIRDLAEQRPEEAERLAALDRLQKAYTAVLPEATQDPGQNSELAVRAASVKALQNVLSSLDSAKSEARQGPIGRMDAQTQKELSGLVSQVEMLRAQSQAELANRQALEKLLAAMNTSRNAALRERRNGKGMLEFHKNMARLATVMDLAFSLNEIGAAQKAISDMQGMLDKKLGKIQKVKEDAADAGKKEEDKSKDKDQWKKEIDDKISKDNLGAQDMLELEGQTSQAVDKIGSFRTDVRALLARMDAEDSGSSPDALTEYRRRQAILPQIAQWNEEGKPGDPDYLSVKRFEKTLQDTAGYLTKIDDGLGRLDAAPVEFALVILAQVPGIPEENLNNPSQARIAQMLDAREAYWRNERSGYQKTLDNVRRRMDPNYTGTEVDDFGESRPYSLVVWQKREQDSISKHQNRVRTILSELDGYSAQINAVVSGANLPMLSGLELSALQDAVQAYPDKLSAVKFPDKDTPEVFKAKMALLAVGKLLPYAGREVLLWSKADATLTRLNDVLTNTLPNVAPALEGVVGIMDALLADVEADRAFNTGAAHSLPENQALIDRKRALLTQGMRSGIAAARNMVQNTIIPFVQKQAADARKEDEGYGKLFKAQIKLYEASKKAVEKTLPWALAANGAAEGDTAGALAGIEQAKNKYARYLTGYDDEKGHHDGIEEMRKEIARRKDPNDAGAEQVYGETQPYSLPRKISQYSAEKIQRAQQINSGGAEVNDILRQIDSLTAGKHGLSAYNLPTDIDGATADGTAKVQRLVDDNVLQDLADKLSELAADYKAKGGSVDVGGGGGSTPPTGTQPSPEVDTYTRVALLCMEAGKRLAPSTHAGTENGSVTFAVARFLFADATVKSSRDALDNFIPKAEKFLDQAKTSIDGMLADLDKDKSYVQGASESSDSVVDRKLAVYKDMNILTRAGVEFYGVKLDWDKKGYDTLNSVEKYYNSTKKIYDSSGSLSDSERGAIEKMKDSLQKTYDSLEQNRVKLARWMAQLNDPHESALKRVAESMSELQDKTRAVLEQNIEYRDIEQKLKDADEAVRWQLRKSEDAQAALQRRLAQLRKDASPLTPELAGRVAALRLSGSGWALPPDAQAGAEALVIPKREFKTFLDKVFANLIQHEPSTQDMGAMRERLLQNPLGISSLIPDAQLLEFGDADGFYLVYQTQLGVPHGLETSSWATLGNVAKIWGNNVSVSGYQFVSPPNDGNAPYGDKGVEVQVESLQGKNWVNYLNVDLHRFIQDAPADLKMESSAKQARLMVFDDFAAMLLGDRLYVGAAGFADFALSGASAKPSYYGGSLKTSLKLTEVMRLNAEQQAVFAKDPRSFFETVNLDFTGLDPDLNRDFVISAKGDQKNYRRTKIGPSFDVARLLGSQDAFTVDFYYVKQSGTDDIAQQGGGVSVLKGFSLRDESGKAWLTFTNRATAELGGQYNSYGDKLTVAMPERGISISAEGRILGDAKTYYFEGSKTFGAYSNVSVGYGSRYAGMENRLNLTMNTALTLGQLWQAVSQGAAEELSGADALKKFNADVEAMAGSGEGPGTVDAQSVEELKRIFQQDVGRKLLTQDIGKLAKEIKELRKAGAILDSTRLRGMVGFVGNPVGEDFSDRASGGGFAAGAYTEISMTRTQKALIEAKAETLYREGLRLQERLIDLTKQWQAAVLAAAQAQWELKMARGMAERAQTETLRAQGRAWEAQAQGRLHEALIRYNLLSGRSPEEPLPFKNLDSDQLGGVLHAIGRMLSTEDRLAQVLSGLDREALKTQLGPESFNLMDWIPWVERLSGSVGVQYQDVLNNQIFRVGAGVRLPIYDPGSGEKDKSYRLESQAAFASLRDAQSQYRLRAQQEASEAQSAVREAEILRPRAEETRTALDEAYRSYRNGLSDAVRLKEAYGQWRDSAAGLLEAEAKSAVYAAWARLEGGLTPPAGSGRDSLAVGSFQDAFNAAAARSAGLVELSKRQEAAAAMARAQSSRIQKFWVDLQVGTGLTSPNGIGFIPNIAPTGLGAMPIPGLEYKPSELRDLQQEQHKGQEQYYDASKRRLEADMMLEIYRAAVEMRTSREAAAILERELIPQAEAALAQANAGAGNGDSQGRIPKAKAALEDAQRRLIDARLMAQQAQGRLNHLLDRDGDAFVEWAAPLEKSLADLQAIFAQKQPVEADREVLKARSLTAHAVQDIADKGLKVEELRVEPVSLVVRSLGRLVEALSSDSPGNPDLAAAARVQALEAERAEEGYDAALAARRAQTRSALESVQNQIAQLQKDSQDAKVLLSLTGLKSRALILSAELARMQGSGQGTFHPTGGMPMSFTELKGRVLDARGQAADAMVQDDPAVFAPEILRHDSSSNVQYFNVIHSVGGDNIHKEYLDGWVELRLRSPETPPKVLLALSRLREERGQSLREDARASARAQGAMLLARFETDVRLQRWAKNAVQNVAGAAGEDFRKKFGNEFQRGLDARIKEQAAQIKALLGLPADAEIERLKELVPSPAGGKADELSDMADDLIRSAREGVLLPLAQDLLIGAVPMGTQGSDLDAQLRADVIAERMSYKGFTPVLAFGMFRGRGNTGLFLEAPDPRNIESSLKNVLSDSLKKELESKGRMQELSLKLHLLMKGVQDKAVLLERRQALARAAQDELRTALAGQGQGVSDGARVLSAEQTLTQAWIDFAQTAADLRGDFAALVTELTALGYEPSRYPAFSSSEQPLESPTPGKGPAARAFEHLSRRVLDEGFSSRLTGFLHSQGLAGDAAAELEKFAALYRKLAEAADSVRASDQLDPARKLGLLSKADVEGRRLRVEASLAAAWSALGGSGQAAFLNWMRSELGTEYEQARAALNEDSSLLDSMREAFSGAMELPRELEGAVRRLEALRRDREGARQTLLESYLSDKEGAVPFILKDGALDRYLQIQTAYDEEVAALFDRPQLHASKELAVKLDSLYGVREALARLKDSAKYGRGMLAMDALIEVENARMAALQWRRGTPQEADEIAASLERLQSLRRSWEDNGTQGLAPLYAARRIQSGAEKEIRWFTSQEELDAFAKPAAAQEGREIRVDGSGGKWEILSGADVHYVRREQADDELKSAQSRVRVHETLKASEFALVPLIGAGAVKAASYEQLQPSTVKSSRFFYFSTEKDGAGLHPALHPLKGLIQDPGQVQTVVYEGSQNLGRDRFPTFESLQGYLAQLEREKDTQAGLFYRLEAGAQGISKLSSSAKEQGLRQLRAGWMAVKLQGYGFAVDKNGEVSQIYVTQDDFDQARAALQEAGTLLPKAIKTLEAAQAQLAQARGTAENQAALAEDSRKNLEQAEQAARTRAQEEAQARFSDTSKETVELEAEHRLRDDAEYAAAAKVRGKESRSASKDADALRKAESARMDALDDIKAAGKAVANAGLWDAQGAAYLQALQNAGLGNEEIQEQRSLLERGGGYSLYRARDLDLQLGADGTLAGVEASPVFGSRGLSVRLAEVPAVKNIHGEVFAAVMDADQSIARLYMDQDAVEAAAAKWKLKTLADGTSGNRSGLDPHMRLLHYVESMDGKDNTKADLPVLLNRRYLISRVEGAASKASEKDSWAFLPWNWGNLALELPKGIIGTPAELISGRDPRQEGFLGRVYLRKIEGGSTEHHGFFRRAAGMVDVLEILPDPVQWYFDPSQFPKSVDADSPLLPGQNLYDKSLRAGGQDVEYGRQSVQRGLDANVEDLLNARKRVLSYFTGGVEETWIETNRGRGTYTKNNDGTRQHHPGFYTVSQVQERSGSQELADVLDDPDVAFAGTGNGEIRLSGKPGHLVVERVQRNISLHTGAQQYGEMDKKISGLDKREQNDETASRERSRSSAGDRAESERRLRAALAERSALEAKLRPQSEEFRKLAWRIGAQEALDSELQDMDQELASMRQELETLKAKAAQLEPQLQQTLQEQAGQPGRPLSWFWIFSIVSSLISAAISLWRRLRRPA